MSNNSEKILKINFSDMWRDFDKYNNFITDVIKERFGGFELSENPDFLFFSCSGTDHYKYNDCVKIFIAGEAVVPDFNICDFAIAYPNLTYGNKYLKHPAWLWHDPPTAITLSDDELLDRKFCNFVYSNESRGTAVEFRKNFAKRLMEYKPIDCPGRVLKNMPAGVIEPRGGNWRDGKIDFIKNYKFTIAFENCKMPGYSTEKIEDPLIAHSVPIYWGDPDVGNMYNVESMIYVNGHEDDLDSVIDRIIYLDTHNEEYLKVLKADPVIGDSLSGLRDYKKFMVNILSGNNIPTERDPMGFGRVMTVPDYRMFELLGMLKDKVISKIKK